MAVLSCCLAAPAAADFLACQMDDGTSLSFAIDRNQFMDAVSAEEPIRRKVTHVQRGSQRYPAEPFIIGNLRGFHADGLGGTSVMFVVNPDGSAIYSNARSGEKLTGTCEDQ